MAVVNIGTEATDKYPLAKMPSLTDVADIQIALRNYHYGQDAPLLANATPTGGIAKYLHDIQASIAAISTDASTVVQESVMDAKGDLIVGTGNNELDNLSVPGGSNGYILTANDATATGLSWAAPAAASTASPGVVQLSDSTSETSSIKAATPTAVSTLKQTVDSSTKTANYTLDPADAGKIIIMNVSSSTSIITIPLETTFPAGARVDILQIGSVQTSIAPVSGSVTLNSKNNNRKLSGQYSAATLIKVGTNSWVLLGDLTA
jgi:hypothetical protein